MEKQNIIAKKYLVEFYHKEFRRSEREFKEFMRKISLASFKFLSDPILQKDPFKCYKYCNGKFLLQNLSFYQ